MHSPLVKRERLRLAAHVRACRVDGQVILLDLRRGKYLGIGGPSAQVLGQLIDDWPSADAGGRRLPPLADLDALTNPLWSKGLITAQPVARPSGLAIEAPSASIEASIVGTRIGTRRGCRLMWCAATSALWLRLRSLESIAEAVAARARRLAARAGVSPSRDEIRNAVGTYTDMRPLLFTTRDRCLHDSLTLLGYLAQEGIVARWVIGVQTRPFGAHSWVQLGDTVLNDEPERVRKFQPILIV